MTWPGNIEKRSTFRRADEDFQRQIWNACAIADAACPGEGRCHGCASWCDDCGDVGTVCHGIECSRHRCIQCRDILPTTQEGEDYDYRRCKECDDAERTRGYRREHAVPATYHRL